MSAHVGSELAATSRATHLALGGGHIRWAGARHGSVGHTLKVEGQLVLHPGGALALAGKNGTGKSTLLRALGGLRRGLAEVSFTAAWVSEQGKVSACVQASYLSAKPTIFSHLTVLEYLHLAKFARADLAPLSIGEITAAAATFGVGDLLAREGSSLSSGQAQRVGLARVALQKQPIVLLDEPSANLDTEGTTTLIAQIRAWRDEGRVVVVATHDDALLAVLDRKANHSTVNVTTSRVTLP